MTFDPDENGFGVQTLWIAPPLLLAGFILPLAGIIGTGSNAPWWPRRFYTVKHGLGSVAFLISLTSYLVTLEPTASLWDCSEFIAAAYKLQVPHTPGTPLSLLIARIFSMLSFGDVTRVAWCINAMSALFSALTILLVYHIIYFLGEQNAIGSPKHRNWTLAVAAFGGSLCLCFSDTFWFSAVEAETYGAACFFLLLITFFILRAKDLARPMRARFMVLIFYLAGLGYCIHPMCLLALPILPFTWYGPATPSSIGRFLMFLFLGLVLVLAISRLVAVGIFELAFSFDLFFVNTIHLPFYSGVVILSCALLCGMILLLRKYQHYAHFTWSFIFLLAGFLPYLMLFIRSNHNPPIDENNPENLSMIKAYMNRESYPTSPLLYGPYYDAQVDAVNAKKKIYHTGPSRYVYSGTMPEYHYENARCTILPRLYSSDTDHANAYAEWTGLKASEKPRFTDNIKFMLRYQFGHMYLRYFLWNFSGRDDDHQNSSWLYPWEGYKESKEIAYVSKAHNQFYAIPLILGILGMVFQYKRNRNGFYGVLILFLVTGFVLALYLNSPPVEPRERDYIYVGSYIAFCIWIGLGIFSLSQIPTRALAGTVVATIIALGVPCWVFYQDYDDHNRAGRTFQVDNARNVLKNCAQNAILFTGGDNDTFPLWYVQEVEGFRTDVRVVVLSYFNTDWYIGQLRKRYYQSQPFALTLDQKAYLQYGPNDVLYIQESIKDGIDVRKYLLLLNDEFKGLQAQSTSGDSYSILPSRTLVIGVDKESIVRSAALSGNPGVGQVSSTLRLHLSGNYLQKNALAFLDLLVSNRWERPVYFNYTSLNTVGIDLKPYVVQEGSLYRLTPFEHKGDEIDVNSELTYRILTDSSDYSNLSNKSVYFNYEDYQARMIAPLRQTFNSLAASFIEEGNPEMAGKTLHYALEKLYPSHLPPSYTNLQAADMLLALGDTESARSLSKSLFDYYYDGLLADRAVDRPIDRLEMYLVEQSAEILNRSGEEGYLSKVNFLTF